MERGMADAAWRAASDRSWTTTYESEWTGAAGGSEPPEEAAVRLHGDYSFALARHDGFASDERAYSAHGAEEHVYDYDYDRVADLAGHLQSLAVSEEPFAADESYDDVDEEEDDLCDELDALDVTELPHAWHAGSVEAAADGVAMIGVVQRVSSFLGEERRDDELLTVLSSKLRQL
eukprot:PLAT2501.1.p1 GENE.PLAT2501.1~~PLAT2501.1.p1  ORF type:complete len:176 (-),score=72.10 PLAT2501.1:50-577(-)